MITSANAGTCTPFQLRQELVKRNCFDLDEEKVCHRTLLQRLMVELVKEETVLQEEKIAKAINFNCAERKAKKIEREVKKREAIERSLARQNNDKDYFKKKYSINQEKKENSPQFLDDGAVEIEDISAQNTSTEEDVFRNYTSKHRSKIFVK